MTVPGMDDAIDAADAIIWRDGKRPVTPRGDVISDALVAACKVVSSATREAVAAEIEAARDDCDQQALAHAGDDARSTATRLRFESMGLAYHRAAMTARKQGPATRRVPEDGRE